MVLGFSVTSRDLISSKANHKKNPDLKTSCQRAQQDNFLRFCIHLKVCLMPGPDPFSTLAHNTLALQEIEKKYLPIRCPSIYKYHSSIIISPRDGIVRPSGRSGGEARKKVEVGHVFVV